jgi:hypothetical protein
MAFALRIVGLPSSFSQTDMVSEKSPVSRWALLP